MASDIKKDGRINNKSNGKLNIKRNEKGFLPSLPSLNGIRIVAAILVYFFHASLDNMLSPFANQTIANANAYFFSKSGWMCVSFFFILSGFVMVWSYKPIDNKLNFYKKRLAKIYPVNIFVMFLFIATGLIGLNQVDIWLPNVLLIQSWLPNAENYIGGNIPSWFLCTIVLFYIIFPFLYKIVIKINPKYLWFSVAMLYLLMIAIQFAVYRYTQSSNLVSGWPLYIREEQWWLSYTFPLTRIIEPIIGMLLSRIIIEGKWFPMSANTGIVLSIIIYFINLFVPLQFSFNLITLIPLILLIGSLAESDIRKQHSFLHSKTMIWLGNISFGFYMIHYFVLSLIRVWTDGEKYSFLDASIIILSGLLVSIFLGWLLYRFIELPCSKFINSGKWRN
ncbi:acyltransferase [Pectobacterium cacticida]|uniref:acyltransferase family protein n=1 Tax=Pectobacterium cacticida TaxID=69221 RepID=UPI002FF04030